MTDLLVLALVAAALFFCVRSIIRNKKKGGSSCGCSCSGSCAGCGAACAVRTDKKEE